MYLLGEQKSRIDITGNKYGMLTVLSYAYTKNKSAYWKCRCDCGNEKIVRGADIKRGGVVSCGCYNRKRISVTHTKDLTNQIFGELTVLSKLEKRTYGRVVWHCRCSCGNYRDVASKELLNGNVTSCGCKNKVQYEDLTGKRFGKLVALCYVFSKNRKAYWKCKCDCGTEKIISSNVLKRISSCGCARIKDIKGKRFGKLIAHEYLYTKNTNAYWKCLCDCGNTYIVNHKSLVSGNTKSCGCLSKDNYKENRYYPKEFIDLIAYEDDKHRAMNNDLLKDEDIWFKCETHGMYKQKVYNKLNSPYGNIRGCPICNQRSSFVENSIREYIMKISGYIPLKKKVLGGKEIDIYIPDINLGIEYNGSAFHANVNGVYDNKSKDYHFSKFLLAKSMGIHLINIFDVDWLSKQEKIEKYLHDIIVGVHKIYARQCKLQEISHANANVFYNINHLQGNTRLSKINYGLYYNNELYAVMGFGSLRYRKNNSSYELHRYCVKSGYTIIGGASKLLRHFELMYKPDLLVSYSDNDYFSGDMYPKLGFVFDKYCTLPYFWYNGKEVLSREKCQPKILKEKYPDLYDPEAKSVENDIMSKLHYYKVYRSGNTRWIKEY